MRCVTNKRRFFGSSAASADRARHSLQQSFRWAARGFALALQERNLRIHLAAAVLVVGLGLLCELAAWQWGLLIVAIVLVLFAEMVNTALERVVDLASPGYAELARTAKDVAAGAVMLTALAALALANVVFAPRLNPLLQGWLVSWSLFDSAAAWVWLLGWLVSWGSLWLGSSRLARNQLLALTPVVLLSAYCLTRWPYLAVATLLVGVLFGAWVAIDCRRPWRFLLGLLAGLVWALWFCQKGML